MTGQEYEKAVQYIYSMLRDGVVKPGDRLPTERAIAETLGISRNSTREALSVLLAMGMVQRRQLCGGSLWTGVEADDLYDVGGKEYESEGYL